MNQSQLIEQLKTGRSIESLNYYHKNLLRLVSEGLTDKDIAEVYSLKHQAVRGRLFYIYEKLEIPRSSNRRVVAAVMYARWKELNNG